MQSIAKISTSVTLTLSNQQHADKVNYQFRSKPSHSTMGILQIKAIYNTNFMQTYTNLHMFLSLWPWPTISNSFQLMQILIHTYPAAVISKTRVRTTKSTSSDNLSKTDKTKKSIYNSKLWTDECSERQTIRQKYENFTRFNIVRMY